MSVTLRVQLRSGTQRVQVNPEDNLRSVAHTLVSQNAVSGGCAFFRDPGFRDPISDLEATMQELGINHGDRIFAEPVALASNGVARSSLRNPAESSARNRDMTNSFPQSLQSQQQSPSGFKIATLVDQAHVMLRFCHAHLQSFTPFIAPNARCPFSVRTLSWLQLPRAIPPSRCLSALIYCSS
eukprot:CAMPEP_0113674786 /NCGR_PEP_ID=MMETSP0038_2-20120614/7633_1 /TAXON_ID=2898 /ORGANISM="Cryptomonas paramecium" /LENGTH=182 /DNA_ID=CAMNT_0000591447 /DNA_START=1 /DNA_END=545 /DNA_ORIENTATION=+ /assembly_acc=CAM_ASM_000170